MQRNRLMTLTVSFIGLLAVTACSSGGTQSGKSTQHGNAVGNQTIHSGGGSANGTAGNTNNGDASNVPFNVAVRKGFRPTAVQMIDTKQAYIAAGSRLYETTSAGHDWVLKWSGKARILKLDFENGVDGFALVAKGGTKTGKVKDLQLWHTTDGGSTWSPLANQADMGLSSTPVPSNARFQLTFHSREVGIITITPLHGSNRPVSVLMTTDGGTKWTHARLPQQTAVVDFASTNTGYALSKTGKNYSVEKTTNGGNVWRTVKSLSLTRIIDARIQTYGSSTVWLTAVRGQAMNQASYVLYRSTDGGGHWQNIIDQNNAVNNGSSSKSTSSETSSQPLTKHGPGTIPVMLDPLSRSTAFFLGTSPARGQGQSQVAKIGSGQVRVLNHYFPGTQGWVLFLNNLDGWAVTTAAGQLTRVYVTKDGGVAWQLKSQFVPNGTNP